MTTELQPTTPELDLDDRTAILAFGSDAQKKISEVSEAMLAGVKNKDLGDVGSTLSEMVLTIKNFDVEKLASTSPNWLRRLFRKATPVAKLITRYSEVEQQITAITDRLEDDKAALLTDVISLDRLYDASSEYLQELEHYIKGGEEKLQELREKIIPELNAQGEEDLIAAQQAKDIENAGHDLERRLHDLRLTRQVTLQSLPGIRLIQENNKSLITRIDSTLINTVPLWKNHLAQALTIHRMKSSAENVAQAGRLTSDLLEANAENLRLGNTETRRQMEAGIFSIDSIRKANQSLIEAIHESVEIAAEGQQARLQAAGELEEIESRLYSELASVAEKQA